MTGDVPTSCKNDLVLVATKHLQMSAVLLKKRLVLLPQTAGDGLGSQFGSQQRRLDVVPTYGISCSVTQQMSKRRSPSLHRIQTLFLHQLFRHSHDA